MKTFIILPILALFISFETFGDVTEEELPQALEKAKEKMGTWLSNYAALVRAKRTKKNPILANDGFSQLILRIFDVATQYEWKPETKKILVEVAEDSEPASSGCQAMAKL